MKTSRPTVHLVLNKAKKNKQGKCPILLRIQFSGRLNCSTGCSTRPSDWDARTESVKSSDADYQSINSKIQQIKSNIIERMNHYETRGLPYTVQMLLDDKISVSKVFSDVLSSMVKVKGLSHNTAAAYIASLHRLEKHFGVGFTLDDLKTENLKGCASSMKRSGMSDSTINVTLACVKSVMMFARSQGLYDGGWDWKYWKVYRINQKHRSLSKQDIMDLTSYFIAESVDASLMGGRWWYKDDAFWALMNRNSPLFALCCGLLCYHLQGVAFADLVRIKAENISVIDVKGEEYYKVSGLKRKKTNRPIGDIIVSRNNDTMPLFECFIATMDRRDNYFLPVLQNNKGEYHYDTEKKVSEATGTCSTMVNKGLKSVFDVLDIEVDGNVSYYMFRHTFSTHFIMDGGNPVELASLMGRSPSGIFRYVQGLNSVEGIIHARYGK